MRRRGRIEGSTRVDALGPLIAPLPALAIGAVVMWRAGLSHAVPLVNVSAALAGMIVAVVAARRRADARSRSVEPWWLLGAALLILAATLFIPGPEGMRRWIPLGSVRIHAGALVLPSVLILLDVVGRGRSRFVAFAVASVLLLQPDLAQAAAFAVGWIVLVAFPPRRVSVGGIVGVVALAGLTLLRGNPLEPVPHVEGIVGIAAAEGGLWLAASVVALALLPLPFLRSPNRRAGVALAAYVACTLIAAWVGNYPVPVMGYGMSPILGYYLGAALLVSVGTRRGPTETGAP